MKIKITDFLNQLPTVSLENGGAVQNVDLNRYPLFAKGNWIGTNKVLKQDHFEYICAGPRRLLFMPYITIFRIFCLET